MVLTADYNTAQQYDKWGDSEAMSRGPGVSNWSPQKSPPYRRNKLSALDWTGGQEPFVTKPQQPIKYQNPIPPNFDYLGGDLRGGPTMGRPRPGGMYPTTQPGMSMDPASFNAYLEKMKAQRQAGGVTQYDPASQYNQISTTTKPMGYQGQGIAVGEPNPGGPIKPSWTGTKPPNTDPYVPEPGGQPPQPQPAPPTPNPAPSWATSGWDPFVRSERGPTTTNVGGYIPNPLSQDQAIHAGNYTPGMFGYQEPGGPGLPTPYPGPGGGGGVPDYTNSERPQISAESDIYTGARTMDAPPPPVQPWQGIRPRNQGYPQMMPMNDQAARQQMDQYRYMQQYPQQSYGGGYGGYGGGQYGSGGYGGK